MFLKWLLLSFMIALSLGQFAVLSRVEASAFYAYDLLAFLLGAAGVFYFLITKKSLIIPKALLLFFAFSFLAFLSLLLNVYRVDETQFLISFFYLVRWFLYLVVAVVVYNMFSSKIITLKFFTQLVLASALFVAVAGFVQLAVLPDLEALDASLGWDPHKNRLVSTFFDPNFTGAYLILSLVVALSFLKYPGKPTKTIMLVILLAIFFTFSRSSWLMLAVIVLLYGLLKSRLFLLVAATLAFLAYFAVPRVQTRLAGITDPSDSAHFRLISWKNTWDIAQDNLLTGVGFNTFRYIQKDYGIFEAGSYGGHSGAGSDSSFLLVLATTGIFGAAVFAVGFLLPPARRLLTKSSGDMSDTGATSLFVGGLAGLLLHSQFVNSLFYPQIMFLWLLFLVLDEISFVADM